MTFIIDAYISNDNGVSNEYSNQSNNIVHMYRNVTFPASTGPYNLTFNVRVQGERDFDYLRVFLVETTSTPVAGSLPSGTTLGIYVRLGADWTTVNIVIPASNAGTTRRLVFTWTNDNSVIGTPPAAVDDIVLWY